MSFFKRNYFVYNFRFTISRSILLHDDSYNVRNVWLDGELLIDKINYASLIITIIIIGNNHNYVIMSQYGTIAGPHQVAILEGFIPRCNNCPANATQEGLGLIGAIIMPHNLYLHSGLVLVSINYITHLEIIGNIKSSFLNPLQYIKG